jgi:dTDP-4-amino-4,6-dideoxygalactose transaminase
MRITDKKPEPIMIPFSPPRIDQKIINAVVETLRSGWITTGPKVKLFEQKLTEYGGHKATLCVNSCTAGLEIILRWFGVEEGDEVIVPVYTYAATANVVIHCGARPVLIDCGTDFNVTAENIEKAITGRTKVIIPVDLAGFPCDYDAINALVRRKDIVKMFNPGNPVQKKLRRILVLADAAHSVGAKYKGKRSGALTDISVYSFHAVKNLTTAEGGAVCLNLSDEFDHKELYKELAIKSLHGQTRDALSKFATGNWRYDIVEPGYKCNLTDIQAAIGLIELERYDKDMLVRRKEIFDLYSQKFSAYDWAQVPTYETQDRKSSYHVYLLRIRGVSEKQRDQIITRIFDKDVSVNVHFIPLALMSYYKSAGYNITDYPVAWDNYSRVVSLPVYYDLTDKQVNEVVRAVVNSVEKVLKK